MKNEKCIEISTNMPTFSIGFEIAEIAFEISEFLRKLKNCETNGRVSQC